MTDVIFATHGPEGWEVEKGPKPQTITDPSPAHASQNRPSEISGGDAIMRTILMHRDEQLCCFLAEVAAIRRQPGVGAYMPLMISRSQVEAIESILEERGYSGWGKRSFGIQAGAEKAA